jgi:hypothetical protein
VPRGSLLGVLQQYQQSDAFQGLAVSTRRSSAPALADMGGMVKQNGQCWKPAKAMDGGTFGYFGACPESASAPATHAHHAQPVHKQEHAR